MQVVIKPYDMPTLMFYDAHNHNRITITICLLRSREKFLTLLTEKLLTLLFYHANNDNPTYNTKNILNTLASFSR